MNNFLRVLLQVLVFVSLFVFAKKRGLKMLNLNERDWTVGTSISLSNTYIDTDGRK
jgi:hypothetical protein